MLFIKYQHTAMNIWEMLRELRNPFSYSNSFRTRKYVTDNYTRLEVIIFYANLERNQTINFTLVGCYCKTPKEKSKKKINELILKA